MEQRPGDDARLIARAKRGELRAYEEIVERHQATAFRVAWVIAASAADAEEATQDAFLKAHRALGRFRDSAPFRPWLLRIVANEARNRRASAQRHERLALRALEQPRPGLPESRLTGVRLLVEQARGGLGPGFYGKFVPRQAEIRRLRIEGHGAVWVQGLHGFYKRLRGYLYRDARGNFRTARARLAATTLLVQHGAVTVRIEGRIDLARAIEIARSLRPAPGTNARRGQAGSP